MLHQLANKNDRDIVWSSETSVETLEQLRRGNHEENNLPYIPLDEEYSLNFAMLAIAISILSHSKKECYH